MQISSEYLKRLKFDPNLKKGFIARYLTNPRLIILLTLSVILVGIFSYLSLPRNLNPEIPIVIVSTVLPGAGPQDIEKLVTIPIEDTVTGLDNVKSVNSNSQDSVSVVQLEFESGVNPDKARTDVQAAVDNAQIPQDATDPRIQKLDFENQPVWQFALISTSNDSPSLIRFAKRLKDEISDLASVDSVNTSGIDEQEVSVVIKPESISSYGLSTQQIAQIIKSSIASYPAGSIHTNNLSFTLTIDPIATS